MVLYTVAAHRPGRRAAVAGLAAGAALVVYGVIAELRYRARSRPASGLDVRRRPVPGPPGSWAARRTGGLAYTAKLEALNDQLATSRSCATRAGRWPRRGRIARELHDVVAHSVSVMVVQAGAARRTWRPAPTRRRPPSARSRSTGRRMVVRRLLGLLRDGDRADGAPSPPAEPGPPGVAGRGGPRGRPAGRGHGRGHPRPLPAGVDLSAYRIVQEALTNSLKHAGPAGQGQVRYGADDLTVQVDDDGPGGQDAEAGGWSWSPSAPRASWRSPAAGPKATTVSSACASGWPLFGGTLETGARPGGGYRVAARLPLDNGSP